MSYAVYPHTSADACWGIFTGDALFVGETGRTDLEDPSKTAENAGRLYDAVRQKLALLGDQSLIFPAHGSGSACGGNISDRDDSTIGIEKHTNPVFTNTREAFIAHKCAEKLPRPPYFAHMEQVNLKGGRPMRSASHVRVLQPHEFAHASASGIVVDTRGPDAFAAAHISGSYNIWLEGLPSFGGWIANAGTAVFLVTENPDSVGTALLHFARIGIDSVQAALAGGMAAWREAGLGFTTLKTVEPARVAEWMREGRARRTTMSNIIPVLSRRRQARTLQPLTRLRARLARTHTTHPHAVLSMTPSTVSAVLTLLALAAWTHEALALDAAALAAKGGPSFPACAQCHGANGEGQAGTGFPRLAGQAQSYLAKQLDEFRSGRRANPIMAPIAKSLPADAVQALSAYYAQLRPESPAKTGAKAETPPDSAAARLVHKGRWDDNIPACFACHAETGAGIAPHFPAISGQRREYTAKQLRDWKAGTRSNDPQGLMKTVASRLSDADIDAVSAYLEQSP